MSEFIMAAIIYAAGIGTGVLLVAELAHLQHKEWENRRRNGQA